MHNGCILCGGVGVGKTHAAIGYYLQNEAPRKVYVITTANKRNKNDWQRIFSDVGMSVDPQLTMGAELVVDSWNNMSKYAEVKDAFFIFDEQRLVGTGAWAKAFYKIAKSNHWIMLSATPGDNWLDYVPVFRANGFIKNITQFKDDHVLQRWTGRYHQITGYRQVGKLVRWRNQLLVDMPYERHTTRHHHDVWVDYDEELVKKLVRERWHVFENRPLSDASELWRVVRRVVYSDASRLTSIKKLLVKHPKLIVFYNNDFELEILRTLASTQSLNNPSQEQLKNCDGQSLSKKATDPSQQKTLNDIGTEQIQNETSDQDLKTSTSIETKSYGSEKSHHIPNSFPSSTESESIKRSEKCQKSNPFLNEIDTEKIALDEVTQYEAQLKSEWETCQNNPCFSQKELWSSSKTQEDGLLEEIPKDHTQNSTPLCGPSCVEQVGIPGTPTSELEEVTQYEAQLKTHWKTCQNNPCCQYCPDRITPSLIEQFERSVGTSSEKSYSSEIDKRLSTTPTSPNLFALIHPHTITQQTTSPGETSGDSSKEGSEEWKLISQSPKSKASATPTHSTDSSSTNSEWQSPEDGLNESTGKPSSTSSRKQSDPCTAGSDSTLSPQFQVAEWNGHRHEAVPTTTSWVYLVQYVAGSEAWECIETDAMVHYSQPYSYKNWHQSFGRIDRINTSFSDLHYYRLISKAVIELAVAKSLSEKKSFNEGKFTENGQFW